jgi:phosphotransferase system IIA component
MKTLAFILALLALSATAQEYVLFSAGPTNGFSGRIVNCRSKEDWKEWRDAHPDLLPSRLPVVLNVATRTWGDTLADVENTPIKFTAPIQARIEIPTEGDHAYRLEVDQDAGEVVPVEIESTRLTPAQYEVAKGTNLTARAVRRQRLTAIKTDLDQVESALDQIDVSASSSYATNIAACTGATKTALQDTRKILVDVKTALKNLRQASEKIRKEIK